MPDLASRSASFGSRLLRTSAGIIFAPSTIRPVSAGRLRASAITAEYNRARMTTARHLLPPEEVRAVIISIPQVLTSPLEFDLRRRLRGLACGKYRHWLARSENRRGP